ncbi:MAG: hypothetical protein OES20_04765 [Gammaproteobacteria bacterium]|nr:hypothetical protein [Gammaproteobacteria bacterium]
MSLRNQIAAVTATIVVLGFTAVSSVSVASQDQANASEHKFELAKQYYGQCVATDASEFDAIRPQLKAFTDMEVMAETMADPAKFMKLMAVVNDPRTIHVMTKCATEPVMWDTWMNGMTDFNKMSRAMGYFMNPNMYMSWMMAPMNPAMYQPMMQMADPAYYTRWMNAMANPAFYQPITSLADPSWYTPRVNWMMNPQSMQPMFNMMNMGGYFAPVPTADNATVEPAN